MRYLNHAGTSFPKPAHVIDAIRDTLVDGPGCYRARHEDASAVIAGRLGASPERILFTSSCTQAIQVALSSLPWEVGDLVITSQLEHQSVLEPLAMLQRLSGVEVHKSPYSNAAPIDLDFMESQLRTGRVRLVVCSVLSNVTSERLPIEELAQLAHRYGALLLADAAQSFGLLDETVTSLGCDLLCFAGHKYALGPQGIGGLWVRPDVVFAGESTSCEVAPRVKVCSSNSSSAMPGYCEVGGLNVPGLVGLAAGLSALGEDRAGLMLNARRLALAFAVGAKQIRGVTVHGRQRQVDSVERWGAAVSCVHEQLPLEQAESFFLARGMQVRAGSHCSPDALKAVGAPEGSLRFSFGPGSALSDVEAALAALSAVSTGVPLPT